MPHFSYLFEGFDGRDWMALYMAVSVTAIIASRYGGRAEALVAAGVACRFLLLMLFSGGFEYSAETWRREEALTMSLDLALSAYCAFMSFRWRKAWPLGLAILAMYQVFLSATLLSDPQTLFPVHDVQRSLSWASLVIIGVATLLSMRSRSTVDDEDTDLQEDGRAGRLIDLLGSVRREFLSFRGHVGRRQFIGRYAAAVLCTAGVGTWLILVLGVAGVVSAEARLAYKLASACVTLLAVGTALWCSFALSAQRVRDTGLPVAPMLIVGFGLGGLETAFSPAAFDSVINSVFCLALLLWPSKARPQQESLADVFADTGPEPTPA